MSLPIVRQSADTVLVFDPATGEQIAVHEATTDKLAEVRDTIRDYDQLARDAKRLIDQELLARFDKAAQWSIRAGVYSLSAPSPAPAVEWDAEQLYNALSVLVAEGVIEPEARDAAVEVEVSYKPKAGRLAALRKLGGRVAEVVDAHRREVPRDRRVQVKRAA